VHHVLFNKMSTTLMWSTPITVYFVIAMRIIEVTVHVFMLHLCLLDN